MDPIILVGLLVLGCGSGILGALFGIGGGIIFVPVLTLVFGVDPIHAVAISLVGIIAGSVGASSVYISKGQSNVRLGLLLEITTATGAIIGAVVAAYLDEWILMVIFSVIVIYSGIRMILNPEKTIEPVEGEDTPLTFEYRDDDGATKRYQVQHPAGGMAMCTVAGMISSMTGVGGGAVKVPLMNIYMHVPIKVASPTSNYMIGITAFSGAITYLLAGQVQLDYAAGVAIGAFVGSLIGTAITSRISTRHLRKYFSVVLFVMAIVVLLEAGGIL